MSDEKKQTNLPALITEDEVSTVIEKAARLQFESLVKEKTETYSKEKLIALGKELDIPPEFIERALRERLEQRSAIVLAGTMKQVRDGVLKRLVAQCPIGSRLERKAENEFTIHFPPSNVQGLTLEDLVNSLTIHFVEDENGQVQVYWDKDTSRNDDSSDKSRKAGVCCIGGSGVSALLHYAGVAGAAGPGVLLAAIGLILFFIPFISKLEEGKADVLVQNIMFTVKELYDLEHED